MSDLQHYQQRFTHFVRTRQAHARPPGVDAKRIKVYADLVYAKMEETLAACFPVARNVLGARRWKRLVRLFLAQHACATPIFRQIPEEFLRWLTTENPAGIPAWLPSLAHYEWVELAIAVSDTPDIEPERYLRDGDLLQGRPVLAPVMMLLCYPFAVHRISKNYQPQAPDAEATHLLAFRRDNFAVKFMQLNSVSARLVALLRTNSMKGIEALRQIAEEMQHPNPARVRQGGLQILENLRDEGAVLGIAR